jgi:hypothetical protein
MRKETTNENCLVVVENNDEAKQLISEVQRYHQDKKLETILDEKGRQHVPLRKIREDPLFQPKKSSSPLIIADFCLCFQEILDEKSTLQSVYRSDEG